MKIFFKYILGGVAAISLVVTTFLVVGRAYAVSTVVVSSENMNGWWFFEETPTGSGTSTYGPSTPPVGGGSTQLTVNGTGGVIFGTFALVGTRLDAITSIGYSTYRTSGSSALAPSLQLDIDTNVTDGSTAWQGRLVYEPYFTHTVSTGVWQTWNPLDNAGTGNWWFTGAPGNVTCKLSNPCTWTELRAAFPNAGVRSAGANTGAVQFKAGGGWASGFVGSVDAFSVGVNSVVTIYDFELPFTVPTTTSISPSSKLTSDSAFTLTLNGTNFFPSSVVRWNGSNRTTTFISATQLTASILSSDLSLDGAFPITIFNTTPGGGTSNAQTFTVSQPPPLLAPPGWNYNAWSDQGVGYTAPASADAYYPSVIYDHSGFGAGTPKYDMWYSDGLGSVYLVTSTDGTTWGAPTVITGINQAHHVQVLYDGNCFGVAPCNIGTTKYRIWFWDMAANLYSMASMATADSADGITWTNKTAVTQNSAAKLIQNPDSGSGWNRGTYGPVSLIYQPTAANTGTEPWNYKYVMYYNGTDGGHEDTGLAYSSDGLLWNAYTSNPVLAHSGIGGSEAWDCMSATYGTVFKDSLGYHFLYSGSGQDNGSGGCASSSSFTGMGYAYSVDGKTWVKDSNPFFHISDGVAYRAGRIYTPSVIHDESGILKMYFSVRAASGAKKIGYATLTEPAILHVIKLVVHGNGGAEIASDFSVHLKNSGVDALGSPLSGVIAPGVGYSLSAGTYIISEVANSAYTQSFTGDCNSSGSITLAAGDDKICTIIDTDIAAPGSVLLPDTGAVGSDYWAPLPLIDVIKIPNPLTLPSGPGLVTYTYIVTNAGLVPMSGVWVKDNLCSNVSFVSGDANNDGLLDQNEFWKYSCARSVAQTETNTATAHGQAGGWDAYDAAIVTVAVGLPLEPPIIHIVKVPNRLVPFPIGGGEVTYSYTVTNPGAVPMHNVVVTDDKCGPLFGPFGDLSSDKLLNPGEIWSYSCKANVAVSTRNIATAEGRGNGFVAIDYAFNDVLVIAGAPALPDAGSLKSSVGFPNTGIFGQQVGAIEVNLLAGSRGEKVITLQQFLISQNKGLAVQALARVGSTGYFGSLTRAALAEFQAMVGIDPALGNFGPITRAYIKSHY